MKLNVNKIVFIILCAISIGLSSVLFGLLMFTTYEALKYISLTVTFALGIYTVKVIHKYPLYIKK